MIWTAKLCFASLRISRYGFKMSWPTRSTPRRYGFKMS